MKIAAMDMLDSRYVYSVNRNTAVELLGPLIRDTDPAVRERAAHAVGYNGCGKNYAKELIAMLKGDSSPEGVTAVAYAMGRSRHRPFLPYLVKLLRHTNPVVRSKVAFELTRLSSKEAYEHNLRLLSDDEPVVRVSAVQNLALTKDRRSIGPIERLLNDKDPHVRERALWALGEFGK